MIYTILLNNDRLLEFRSSCAIIKYSLSLNGSDLDFFGNGVEREHRMSWHFPSTANKHLFVLLLLQDFHFCFLRQVFFALFKEVHICIILRVGNQCTHAERSSSSTRHTCRSYTFGNRTAWGIARCNINQSRSPLWFSVN